MKAKSLLVAVVDDDSSVRKALRRLLRASGYIVEAYASGPEFLDSLKQNVPDCAILDMRMQPMSGLDVQAELVRRSVPIPLIFISAADDSEIRNRALKQGAVAYLQKPLTKQALLKVFASLFDISE